MEKYSSCIMNRDSTFQIVLNHEVRDMLDHFTGCFGIRIGYFTPAWTELKIGGGLPLCAYCQLGRGQLFGAHRCLELDRLRRDEAQAKGEMVFYQCHAGLTEAVAPVIMDELLVGFLMIGQFRTTDTPPPDILEMARERGVSGRDVREAFAKTTFIEPEKVPHILGLFECLVRQIGRERLVAVQGELVVEKVLQHLRRHPERNVRLEEAAQVAGRSCSTVSHLFREKLGRSFKEVQIKTRLEVAAELLRDAPHLNIAEIAARLGYGDPFYFSRIFRKYYGMPPSETRAGSAPAR